MCDEWKTDEQWFGKCGLVKWSCEQEVSVRFGD
jgi:hypothetical protein